MSVIRVALVTAYNDKGELLLGRRRDNGRFTLAGGHLEDGEDPRDGALRELLEETGLTPKSLSFVTKYTTSEDVELNVYSAYVTGEPHSQLDPDDEVSEWKFVDVSKGMPSKIDSKLHGPEDESNILRQLYELGKSELLKALPRTEKCAKCSKQATTRVLWAEGMAYQPACDDHIKAVKKPFVDKDEFSGLRPITKAEHEVARLLAHPNPVERLMALRLNTVAPDHVRSAMLDANPQVHQAAISHPMFCDVDGMPLCQAPTDSAGNYPLANQLAFLRSPHVCPQHLSELISRSPTVHPSIQQQLFDEIIKHPALAPDDISRLYSDYGTTGAQRLALLDHPSTPEPVLHQAIKLGVEVPGDAQPFSMKAAVHPNLSPEFRSAFIRRIPVSAPEHLLALGCHILRSGPTTPELFRDLQVQRSLKGAPFDRLMGAYLQGPSATADDIAQAIESGNPALLQGAAQSRALLPHQLDSIVAKVKASGDQEAMAGLMDHKFFGNRHLQMLMAKREVVTVDQAMVGHFFVESPEFAAAKFLSGLPEVTESSAQEAYFHAGQDICTAALMAYGLEVTKETLASLKGAVGLGMAPDEVAEEKLPTQEVIAALPAGADAADSVRRASAAGKLVHVRNGVLRADDPKGPSWFLRPAIAGYSPQSEAAWYMVAKAWGVEKHYPRTELLTLNGKPYAATVQVPGSYKTLWYIAQKDPNVARTQLGHYLSTGQVHIWAAMDAILGNRVSDGWNVLAEDRASEKSDGRSMYAAAASIRTEPCPEPPGIYFIHHGDAFSEGDLPDSAAFVPFILTVFSEWAQFGVLSLEERLQRLPRVDARTALVIKNWLLSLDATVLPDDACAARLERLLDLLTVYPADEAINRYFCFAFDATEV